MTTEQITGKPRWLATCPRETRDVLVGELAGLGVEAITPLHRGVAFAADLATGYRAHLWLRTASRIQRVVAEVPAGSVAELAQQVQRIDWTLWLRKHRPFMVQTILTDRAGQGLGQGPVADAVAQAVMSRFALGSVPPVPTPGSVAQTHGSVAPAAGSETPGRTSGGGGPAYRPQAQNAVTIVAHLRNGVCTLGLDTAGRALHKRGWRLNGHPAVLKETLAAALLLLAGYEGTEPLLDPMCGSGTIIIEAAYIALNKAVLIHRGKDDFALEHLAGFDRGLWRKVADELRAGKRIEPRAPLFAGDIRPEYVDLARRGALRARVEKYITFRTGAFKALAPPADHGLLVANLPHGQRLGQGELPGIYAGVGRMIRERYARWRVALLAAADGPIPALGLRGARQVPLMNGALPVRLVIRD